MDKYWKHVQIVSYETAKLAEEKGFDWQTNELSDKLYLYDGELIRGLFSIPFGYEGPKVLAPTQTLLQRWLREEQNIDVHAYLIELVSNGVTKLQHLGEKDYSYMVYINGEPLFIGDHEELTYEEALEEALKLGLKEIA